MTDLVVKVEDVNAGHLVPYAELSRAEYGESPISDLAHLHWKFLENPQGTARAVHVFNDRQLIGRLVAQPRLFRTPAGITSAAYMVDMVVHPEHRSMPALLALFHGFRQLRDGFSFVLVTPNSVGAAVWKNFAKLREPFALGVSVVLLRPAVLARRIWPRAPRPAAALIDRGLRAFGSAVASVASFERRVCVDRSWPADDKLDALLDRPHSQTIAGVRDRRFLMWRFNESPVFKYEVDFIYKDEVLCGYLATRRIVFAGYDTRFIIDAYGTEQLTPRDWAALVWRMIRAGFAPNGPELLMILGNSAVGPLATLARAPFAKVPDRFLPQKVSVFAEWWSSPAFALTRDDCELTLADCDMV